MKTKLLLTQKITALCGSENHLIELIRGLDKTKFEVHFLAFLDPNIPVPKLRERVLRAGAKLHNLNIKSRCDIVFFIKLILFLLKNRFHIIHTHLIHADLFVTLASVLTFNGIRLSTKHADNEFRRKTFIGWIDGRFSIFQKKVIVISEFLRNFYLEYENIPDSKIKVIRYAYKHKKLSHKTDIREEFKLSHYSMILLIVARLVPYKGHLMLLKAFKRVLEKHPEIKLFIVGDGPEKNKLNKYCLDNSLQQNVVFTGYRADTHEFYRVAEIVFLVSETEGFGLTTLEAMDHGKPLIVSDSGAMPEIVIQNKTGLLFPPKDEDALFQCMVQLIGSKANRGMFGKEGKKRVQTEFSHDEMVKKYEDLYINITT